MKSFELVHPEGLDHGAMLCAEDGAAAIAGGTNLVDLMKLEVETPTSLVDLNRLPLSAIDLQDDGSLRIGALASNTAVAVDERVRRDWPVLSRAILAGATQQLRNKATTGGNLCQRTRCYYFTDTTQPCNKREPGSGCGAMGGVARLHAVLGTSTECIATYPGDMAVALAALDAQVEIVDNTSTTRMVSVRDFHRLPGDTPWRDNILEAGELITAVILPSAVPGRQLYRKVRERSSYAFALVSVAAVVEMNGDHIARADLAFGGLAHKPWHNPALSECLVGKKPGAALFDRAADLLLADARGYGDNDFKIPLARRTLASTLAQATGVTL